jgi:hypothetical protein
MFQQIIQDVLAIAEAGPRAEDLLERLRARIIAFETFECGELVIRTEKGVQHHVFAPGLGDLGLPALTALEGMEGERTLRLDTAAEFRERGLLPPRGLTSLLVLRVEGPGFLSAALVLGHSRAWSFAAAPLSRIRTLGGLTARLLLRTAEPAVIIDPVEVVRLRDEVARLRTHASSLEAEIVALRAERAATKRSDKPR